MASTQLPSVIGMLIDEIFDSAGHPLAQDMAAWMVASKRFRVFVETYRDKIRKKVRNLHDPEGQRDLWCELAVAYWLLQEPRFNVQYERQSALKQRAPDFMILYKDHLPFHVEVTRIHTKPRDPIPAPSGEDARLAHTVCWKLGQMQPGAINILTLLMEGRPYAEADIVATTRALLMRASQKEEAYFAREGFSDSRDFLHHYQRLSGIVLISGWQQGVGMGVGDDPRVLVWVNNQARHPIPGAILNIMRRIVTPAKRL